MYILKWIQAAVLTLTLVILALPAQAGNPAGGYDRMDGDFVRPNRRPTPKRDFSNAPEGERVNTYSAERRTSTFRTQRNQSRSSAWRRGTASKMVNPQARPYLPHVTRVTPEPNANDRFPQPEESSGEVSGESVVEYEPDERGTSPVAARRSPEDGEPTAAPEPLPTVGTSEARLVYCSKTLHEYHLDPNCAMLTNYRPTPMSYESAKAANYVECTHCGSR